MPSPAFQAAAVQFEPSLGAKEANIAGLLALVEEAAAAGGKVLLFKISIAQRKSFRQKNV